MSNGLLHGSKPAPYDVVGDPLGELFWRGLANEIAKKYEFKIISPKRKTLDSIISIVDSIIDQFRFLIEDRRISEELYYLGSPRPEKAAQRLFFSVAYSYCKANNLDVTPEADTGNGPVDFKFSTGFTKRVVVEIKLSTNNKLVDGYTKQTLKYQAAEEARAAYYVVINVGRAGQKLKQVEKHRANLTRAGKSPPTVVIINGLRKPSASKL